MQLTLLIILRAVFKSQVVSLQFCILLHLETRERLSSKFCNHNMELQGVDRGDSETGVADTVVAVEHRGFGMSDFKEADNE